MHVECEVREFGLLVYEHSHKSVAEMTLVLPNSELQVVVRKALNEDVLTRDRDLEIIKTWLRQQPHLPNTWNEVCLLNFLRGSNFSLEKCKRKLDMYFTMKGAVPEFFSNRDIRSAEMNDIIQKANLVCLPGITPDGRRVNLAANSVKYEYINFASVCKYVTMMADVRLQAEQYGVSGDIYILDAELQLIKPFIQISPVLFKKFFICVQEAFPVKIKEVHIINPNSFVSVIYAALKPLLKEKLRSRIHIHTTLDTLYDYVPKSILPDEYGGTAGKICNLKAAWIKKMDEYREWFKETDSIVADESKRIGSPVDCDELFGVDGSFKQLNID